ncbi:sodium:calcium antiporter [Candidatus Shapirobacteria bacterium]|nr:sodium:calcium antiporter [Candidatus Shapirobacteria bacterium]
MFALNIFIYAISFIAVWFGAGLIIAAVDKLSKKIRVSSFALSFFVLGLLTSIPEFAVGLTAISENNPEIFAGNLIGGIVVIFLLIIPLLAIFGNGVKLNSQLNDKNLLFSFIVMLAPTFMVLDRKVSNWEGIVLIGLYAFLFYFIQKNKGVLDNGHAEVLHARSYSFIDILKIILGIALVFVSSNLIVDRTIYFANAFNISAFYISLIVLSLGTNIPEISLGVRSVISGKKDVAFGDFVGSASANTLLFGLFTLLNSGEVITASNFINTLLLLAFGLGLFYYFTRSKHDVSRKEGFILFGFYCFFVVVELFGLIIL